MTKLSSLLPESTVLHNLCLHFARQDGHDGKNRKENHTIKVTLIPKTKKQIYWMNKTLVVRGRKQMYHGTSLAQKSSVPGI